MGPLGLTAPSLREHAEGMVRGLRRLPIATMILAALTLLLAIAVGHMGSAHALPSAADGPPAVELTFFHGDGCPHCADEREFLTDLKARVPALRVTEYEVWFDEDNRRLLDETAERLGFEPAGVPVTVVGTRAWVGFSTQTADEIEAVVVATAAGRRVPGADEGTAFVDVPLVGAVDLSTMSLVASTAIIGFVDGVNPCSLWVLSLLLAIVLHHGSRRRVLVVGLAFLTVTTTMYALFIAGLYSALDVLGSFAWIQAVTAAIVIVLGLLQLKDGISPGKGPSLSIPASRKPRIYTRMRDVASPERGLLAAIAVTALLAVGVSLIETPCTAGLPLMWTSLLEQAGLPFSANAALFALYMGAFLLDELIVFLVAVVSLQALRLQERHGRALKLLSGCVLVTLGAAMLLAPTAMQSLTGTLLVFAIAGVTALAAYAVTRRGRAG